MVILPYFAYGANLSYKHLISLGIKWDKALPAVMNNYQVIFNKKSYDGTKSYANIEPTLGHKVYGVIYYGLTEDDYLILDKKEGVAYGHYARESMAVLVNNEPILAYAYVAQNKWIDKEGKLKPSKIYLDKLWEGKEYLSAEHQEKLKKVKVMEGGEFGNYLTTGN